MYVGEPNMYRLYLKEKNLFHTPFRLHNSKGFDWKHNEFILKYFNWVTQPLSVWSITVCKVTQWSHYHKSFCDNYLFDPTGNPLCSTSRQLFVEECVHREDFGHIWCLVRDKIILFRCYKRSCVHKCFCKKVYINGMTIQFFTLHIRYRLRLSSPLLHLLCTNTFH